jgi:NAD(P)-dependent dehydrogenase (short-subunit alcohol dehydrogenase family)
MTTTKARGRKSIFITGAASGMGREGAKLFVSKGWYVGASDVNEDGLKTLTQELGSDNVFARKLDVRDNKDFDTALREFGEATGGTLDIMWNNAGIGESGWFEDVPYEATKRVVDINLMGVLHGVYAALPLLKAAKNSLLFTTSSSSATYGMPRIAVYAATKFAVKGLTEALSIEFARHGIRVADTLPGLIDTAIPSNTPNHSGNMPQARSSADIAATAPKKGMFRLMPAMSVAESVWAAYHDTKGKLHWYVPKEIGRIDKAKAISPEFVRKRIMKGITARMIEAAKRGT